MQWHHNDPSSGEGDGDEPIAASHKGPVMVYVAKADTNGEGAVWTKIYEDGLTNGKWGVDNFIANKGLVEITLPDLEAGDYLIRPEMIGLHEASAEAKAQFYNGCGQIKVTGSGSASLPATGVDMTKAYKATDPGVLFNIYGGATDYTVPGPKVWDGASTGGSAPSTPSEPAASAAPSSAAPSPASSAAPSATPSPVEEAEPSTPSATKPAATPAAPSSGNESGSALPETFTIEQFIQWLKTTTGSSASKARRHARAFHF